MTSTTRETILFWCQVGVYLTLMIYALSLMVLMWFLVISTLRGMEEGRARDKAMLEQHQTELRQHHEAMQDHRAQMERLAR